MSFKDQLKQDMANSFLNSYEFAEDITYTPKNGTPKSIKAVINRKRLNPAAEDIGRVLTNQGEIFLANHSTGGVVAVNKGGDVVSFPDSVGGSPVDWAVIDVLGQDEGMWHLLVQK
jgi:hypothetical protein